MKTRILLVIAIIAAVSVACSFSNVITPAAPSGDGTLYRDDFSNPNSGWDRKTTDGGTLDYANGQYRIYVTDTYADLVAGANTRLPADVAIDVDITRSGGSENNDFGVLCRVQDLDNFYFFQISSDGFAVIGKFEDNSMEYLSADSMLKVDGIYAGTATNHMRAVCQGNTLYLYANGNLLASATDSTFTSGGDVGLMAGTFDEGGVDILFDNFVVTAP